jgi:hypothetical protein
MTPFSPCSINTIVLVCSSRGRAKSQGATQSFSIQKMFWIFFFLSTVKTITHEPSHATTTQIKKNSFQLNFFFSSKNWNKKNNSEEKKWTESGGGSLSPMCVWVALEWFNANPSNTHTHTHTWQLCVASGWREDRRRARLWTKSSSLQFSSFLNIYQDLCPWLFLSLVWFFSCCLREGWVDDVR